MRCRLYSIQKVLEYFPFKQKHFQKNVHCNIVKHTTKPHLIGAIENINTIDDYRPKIVRIIVFFYYHHSSNRRHFAIKTLFLASFDRVRQWLRVFSISHYPVWKQPFFSTETWLKNVDNSLLLFQIVLVTYSLYQYTYRIGGNRKRWCYRRT